MRGRALDRLHRRHTELDHARELLCNRFRPGNASHVGSECDLDPGLQGFAKGFFVRRNPQTIALSLRRIGWSVIVVINAQRRAEPRSLLDHLSDLRIRQNQAVLDRIAAAIKGALHARVAIGMTCDLLSPSMGLIDDSPQLFDGECWL